MNSETNPVAATPVIVTPKPAAQVVTNVNVTPAQPAKARAPRHAKKQAVPATFTPSVKL